MSIYFNCGFYQSLKVLYMTDSSQLSLTQLSLQNRCYYFSKSYNLYRTRTSNESVFVLNRSERWWIYPNVLAASVKEENGKRQSGWQVAEYLREWILFAFLKKCLSSKRNNKICHVLLTFYLCDRVIQKTSKFKELLKTCLPNATLIPT